MASLLQYAVKGVAKGKKSPSFDKDIQQSASYASYKNSYIEERLKISKKLNTEVIKIENYKFAMERYQAAIDFSKDKAQKSYARMQYQDAHKLAQNSLKELKFLEDKAQKLDNEAIVLIGETEVIELQILIAERMPENKNPIVRRVLKESFSLNEVQVKKYERKGETVKSHKRTLPDGREENNLSFKK